LLALCSSAQQPPALDFSSASLTAKEEDLAGLQLTAWASPDTIWGDFDALPPSCRKAARKSQRHGRSAFMESAKVAKEAAATYSRHECGLASRYGHELQLRVVGAAKKRATVGERTVAHVVNCAGGTDPAEACNASEVLLWARLAGPHAPAIEEVSVVPSTTGCEWMLSYTPMLPGAYELHVVTSWRGGTGDWAERCPPLPGGRTVNTPPAAGEKEQQEQEHQRLVLLARHTDSAFRIYGGNWQDLRWTTCARWCQLHPRCVAWTQAAGYKTEPQVIHEHKRHPQHGCTLWRWGAAHGPDSMWAVPTRALTPTERSAGGAGGVCADASEPGGPDAHPVSGGGRAVYLGGLATFDGIKPMDDVRRARCRAAAHVHGSPFSVTVSATRADTRAARKREKKRKKMKKMMKKHHGKKHRKKHGNHRGKKLGKGRRRALRRRLPAQGDTTAAPPSSHAAAAAAGPLCRWRAGGGPALGGGGGRWVRFDGSSAAHHRPLCGDIGELIDLEHNSTVAAHEQVEAAKKAMALKQRPAAQHRHAIPPRLVLRKQGEHWRFPVRCGAAFLNSNRICDACPFYLTPPPRAAYEWHGSLLDTRVAKQVRRHRDRLTAGHFGAGNACRFEYFTNATLRACFADRRGYAALVVQSAAESSVRPVLDAAKAPGTARYAHAALGGRGRVLEAHLMGAGEGPAGPGALLSALASQLRALRKQARDSGGGGGDDWAVLKEKPVAVVLELFPLIFGNEGAAGHTARGFERRVRAFATAWRTKVAPRLHAGSRFAFIDGPYLHGGFVVADLPLPRFLAASAAARAILGRAGWLLVDGMAVTAPRPDYRHTVEMFNREKGLPPGGVPFMLATVLLNALCNDFGAGSKRHATSPHAGGTGGRHGHVNIFNDEGAKPQSAPERASVVLDGGAPDPRAMVLDFSDDPNEEFGVDEAPP
jgi:hypothetical protein